MPVKIEQLAKEKHRDQRNREEQKSGIFVINSRSQIRANKFGHENNCEDSADIPQDCEHDRENKNCDFLPKFVLGEMHVIAVIMVMAVSERIPLQPSAI